MSAQRLSNPTRLLKGKIMIRYLVFVVALFCLLLSTIAYAGEAPIPSVPDLAPLLGGLVALAGVVIAAVAGIKSLCTLEGWKTIAAIVGVSLLLCCSLIAYLTPALWWHGPIVGVLVAILSLCGDVYLSRLALKAGKNTTVNLSSIAAPSDEMIAAVAARAIGPAPKISEVNRPPDRDTEPGPSATE